MSSSNSSFHLFLQVDEPGVADAGLELVLYGTSHSGYFGGLPFYLYCSDSGNVAEASLPLFLEVSSQGESASNMNLFTEGRYGRVEGSLDLFLKNQGQASGLTLFVKGSGATDGYYPYSAGMNLFLARDTTNSIPFFLASSIDSPASGFTAYVFGGVGGVGTLALSVPDVVGGSDNTVRLFTRGF